MTRLDTIKVSMPIDCITSFDKNDSRVVKKTEERNDVAFSYRVIDGHSSFGVKRTSVRDHEVIINLSAKCLLDNYFEGINRDTIEQVVDSYNSVSPLKIDSNSFLEHSVILSCDSTQMIYPDYDLSLCRESMTSLRTNSRCRIVSYSTYGNCGIEINSSIKREKRRLIMYSKYTDMTRTNKANRAFLHNCSNPTKLISLSEGSWRVEQNHSSFSAIERRFNTDRKLSSILNSTKNPNYDYLVKVRKDAKDVDLFFDDYADYSISQLEKTLGMIHICNELDRDIELIKTFFKSRIGHRNHYRVTKRYEKLLTELNEKDMRERGVKHTCKTVNDHIFDLVRNAA